MQKQGVDAGYESSRQFAALSFCQACRVPMLERIRTHDPAILQQSKQDRDAPVDDAPHPRLLPISVCRLLCHPMTHHSSPLCTARYAMQYAAYIYLKEQLGLDVCLRFANQATNSICLLCLRPTMQVAFWPSDDPSMCTHSLHFRL